MGYGNQPVFTPLGEGKEEHNLSNRPSGADSDGWNHNAYTFEDDMSFPSISQVYDQLPGSAGQGSYYSYTPNQNCKPDPKIEKNCHTSEFCTGYEMLPPDMSMNYGKSEISMNFAPQRFEFGTGYPIKTHGAESRFHMSGQFSSSKCSTSLLPLVDNFGAKGDKNDINIFPLSSSAPQKLDRNFLTLGTGGCREVRPNSNFSSQEISNKLKEMSSQCNNPIVGHWPKNPMSLTQLAGVDARTQTNVVGLSPISNSDFLQQEIASKLEGASFQCNTSIAGHYPNKSSNLTQLAGGNAIIQTNAGGLSRPAYSSASRMPNFVEGPLVGDTRFRQNSIPNPGLQTMQANAFSSTPPHYTAVPQMTPVPFPYGSTLYGQPKYDSQPKMTSTYFANQPISWEQDCSRKNFMKASESSRDCLSHRLKHSSIGHIQAGDLSLAAEGTKTEVAKIGFFPSSVQPVGQFDGFHNVSSVVAPTNIYQERMGVQFPRSSTYQSDAAGWFPKRLGLLPNDFATAQSVRGHHHHPMTAQSPAVFPRFDNSNGKVVPVARFDTSPQVAPVISRPPLKRKAVANPITVAGQRRKIFPQPGINDSTTQKRQSIPPHIQAALHGPPPTLHVKWKDCEEAVKPIGERCFVCKLDLSFRAASGMYNRSGPPPVAVLPCGHAFHDHCLQKITPEDQAKDPPCIPCAMAET